MVAFDNPWPPDYGGAIEVFYKLRALARAGAEIILHVFTYGRNDTSPLRRWASEVYTYERPRRLRHVLSPLPFIVASRMHPELTRRLKAGPPLILFEGIHTTGPALVLAATHRLHLRPHNIEHRYYRTLARTAASLVEKWFFRIESLKLGRYERRAASRFHGIHVLHPADADFFRPFNRHVTHVPAFHPFDKPVREPETEPFVLFHGNLSVPENARTALRLWREVMRYLPFPFVVAGKRPPAYLRKAAREGFTLIADPGEEEMNRLVSRARVHLMDAPERNGLKLKLLHALFRGHYVVARPTVVDGTGLEEAVEIAPDPQAMQDRIRACMERPVLDENRARIRDRLLSELYDNDRNARKLLAHVR